MHTPFMRPLFVISAIMLLAPALFSPVLCFAEGGTSVQPGGSSQGIVTFFPNLLDCQRLDCVVNKLLEALAKMAPPFVAVMVLIGAFQIMTAGGSPEKFRAGQKTILYSVIGYAVI